MKKLISITTLLILLVGSGLLSYSYLASSQDITLTIKNPTIDYSIDIYKTTEIDGLRSRTGESIKQITKTENFSLKKDIYVLLPSGKNIDTSEILLPVGDSPVNQTIDVAFSAEYLESILPGELPSISTTLTTDYPKIATDYTIQPGKLLQQGEWFITIITNNRGEVEYDQGDTLRVVMQKKNNAWVTTTAPPAIIIDRVNYPDIPKKIAEAANDIPVSTER